jgi:hypothetical protein
VNTCEGGQHAGILARGIKPGVIRRGMVATTPGGVTQTDFFEASIYMLKKDEGGRAKPIVPGYIQPFMTNTCTIDCNLRLPEDKTLLMGGENINLQMLLAAPMALQVGDKFTSKLNMSKNERKTKVNFFFLSLFEVREGLNRTTCTGVITKLLPKSNIKLPGFNVAASKTKSNQSAAKKK